MFSQEYMTAREEFQRAKAHFEKAISKEFTKGTKVITNIGPRESEATVVSAEGESVNLVTVRGRQIKRHYSTLNFAETKVH